ncbi:decaprenyl-phosphate phosphoribosyltransferase [candidate division WWE3 bacterium]|nr:decaprenyl-phosphate phosphoribosyltransferase [candidate division WWE3 bacterium]
MNLEKFKNGFLYHHLRTLRPRQWLKNLSIYAAPLFWGNLFDTDVIIATTKAVVIFTLASSATYLINDVIDAPKDRVHPIKRNRPIAHGQVKEEHALIMAAIFIALSLYVAYTQFNRFFLLSVIAYLCIQITYSLYFRNQIILDALVVATGFVLRVFAGTFAASVPISSWLVLSTIGISLLLAFGKRRSERTILQSEHIPLETRETLKHYPDNLLDSMISMSASFAVLSYALFAFQTSPTYTTETIAENLPKTLASPKWMMLTIPIVIYGVARYLYVIYEKKEGESPERVLLSDSPLLNTVAVWIISILLIVYGLQGS